MKIELPYNLELRDYQTGVYDAMVIDGSIDRSILVWHRRSGKDLISLSIMLIKAMETVGTYWYLLPKQTQVRKAIWQGVNAYTGKNKIDEVIPKELIKNKRENEMSIELVNGSMIHFLGSDSFDSLVGSPPVGIVFSEYALTNPLAYGILSPILHENNGWCIMNSTPRGTNHLKKMYDYGQDANWYVSYCTPEHTKLFTDAELAKIESEYVALYGQDDGKALFMREYWCDWNQSIIGSYYSSFMADAYNDNRITDVSHDVSKGVYTAWDLGKTDSTSIWFWQMSGNRINVIDYYSSNNKSISEYAKLIHSKPYLYLGHYFPHDLNHDDLFYQNSRKSTLIGLGINPIILSLSNIQDGIQAVRNILGRCYFDKTHCELGIESLKNYQREYDEVKKIYADKPLHDWSSHGADAFRYMAISLRLIDTDDITIVSNNLNRIV